MLRISLGHEAPPVDAHTFFCVDDVSTTSYSPILGISLPRSTLQALSVATRGAFRIGVSVALWRWDDAAVWNALGLTPPVAEVASEVDGCTLPRARTVAGSVLPRVLVASTEACEDEANSALPSLPVSSSSGEETAFLPSASYPALLSRANTHYHIPSGSYCLCLLPTHRLGPLPTVSAAAAQLAGRAGWLTQSVRASPERDGVDAAAALGSQDSFLFPLPSFPSLSSSPPSLLLPRLAALLSRAPLCAHSLLKARAATLASLPGGGAGAGTAGPGAGAGHAGRGAAAGDALLAALAGPASASASSAAVACEEAEGVAGKSSAGGAVVVATFAQPAAGAFPALPASTAPAASLQPSSSSSSLPLSSWGPGEPSKRLQMGGLLRHWGVFTLPLPQPAAQGMGGLPQGPRPLPQTPAAGPALVTVSMQEDSLSACVQGWHSSLASADSAAAFGASSAGDAWARARVCLHSADPSGGPALAALVLGHLFPAQVSASSSSSSGSAVAGVLLSGPSGSGKRTLVHSLAAAASAPLVTITYAALRARALTVTPALSAPAPHPNTAATSPAGLALAEAAAAAPAPGAGGLALGAAAHSLLSAALARAAPRVVVLFDAAHEPLPAATVAGADVAAGTAAMERAVAEFNATAGASGRRAVLVATTDAVGRVNGPAKRKLFPATVALAPPGQMQRARALAASLAGLCAQQQAVSPAVAQELLSLLPPEGALHKAMLLQADASAGSNGSNAVVSAASETLRGVSLADIAAVASEAHRRAHARALASGSAPVIVHEDIAEAAAHVSALFLSRSPLAEPPDPARLRGFAPIVGLAEGKMALQQTLLWPLRHPRVFARLGLSAASSDPVAAAAAADAGGAGAGASGGVLLYGPPGTGKTMLARACAAEFGLAMFSITAPMLLKAGVGESERLLRRLFKAAAATAPSVIVMDDVHSVFPASSGDGDDDEGGNSLLSELLQLLDARISSAAGAVFIVATAPAPAAVHSSLLRAGRLERRVFLSLPGDRDRAAAALGLARGLGLLPAAPTPAEAAAAEAAPKDEWGSEALAEVALASRGLSYAALAEAFGRAQQKAHERAFLRAHAPGVTGNEESGVRVKDVVKALRKMKRAGFSPPASQ